MARNAFYSFHFQPDNWRAAQVRGMGVLEGNEPASDNDWEAVKRGGEAAIQKWIDGQMSGRSVAIVLVGNATAGRKWINYEIEKGWNDKKGVLGIYVHNLKNREGNQTTKGSNPFETFTMKRDNSKLSSYVRCYDPPYSDSKQVYGYIHDNLGAWIEAAIKTRDNF